MNGLIRFDNRIDLLECTGCIYNYAEIDSCCTNLSQAVISAYNKWGVDCMNHLDGTFAFILYDKQQDVYFGARDRFGVQPFYYYLGEDFFCYSSNLKELVDRDCVKVAPDYQLLFDYLTFNRTDHTENTFFAGVKKLLHGHYFILKNGDFKVYRWYNLRERINYTVPFRTPEEFRVSFTTVIRKMLDKDKRQAISLSGGLDSSTITSIICKVLNVEDFQSFSAVYQHGSRADESDYIAEFRQIVPRMNYIYPNEESVLNDLENFLEAHPEPMPSLAPYAQYKVMEVAQGNVDVVFDGQGADEEMAGYSYAYGLYFKELFLKCKFRKLFKEMRAYYKVTHSTYCFKTFVFFLLLPGKLKTLAKSSIFSDIDKTFAKQYRVDSRLALDLYSDSTLRDSLISHFEYKLEHLLKWAYCNASKRNIECKEPFLDYQFVERILATDNDWKICNGLTKFIMREALKGIMPEKIRCRTDKVGFATPQDEWLRSDAMKPIILDIINSESFASRGLFNVAKVKSLYNSHCAGDIDISKTIWKWINTELWFRKFSYKFK